MAEQAESRRMRLIEKLADSNEPLELEEIAISMHCDERTIRRDLDLIQQLFQKVNGLEIRRGKVITERSGYSQGYFTNQLDKNPSSKEKIARAIVASLSDDQAIALTAGSTTYAVAKEIRRVVVEDLHPRNLIVFTNSVPSLLELVAAGVSTGVLGDIYSAEDCAFHTAEFHSAFQPSVAIIGASGVLCSAESYIDLFSHRAEEAAFLRQLLATIPEIIIAVDSSKLGRRHPWSFGGESLNGKTLRLITDTLSSQQHEELSLLAARLMTSNTILQFKAVGSNSSGEK